MRNQLNARPDVIATITCNTELGAVIIHLHTGSQCKRSFRAAILVMRHHNHRKLLNCDTAENTMVQQYHCITQELSSQVKIWFHTTEYRLYHSVSWSCTIRMIKIRTRHLEYQVYRFSSLLPTGENNSHYSSISFKSFSPAAFPSPK